ncbi:MAG: hypothetical protein ACYC0X_26190 [Pirellulaceae bacterium]
MEPPIDAFDCRKKTERLALVSVIREIEGVDFLFGQVVSAGDGAVVARFRESWESIQEILFPCPGHDRPEVFAGFVRSATGI